MFILDGTEEEMAVLRQFFGKYNRYYFCENEKNDILETINTIAEEQKKFAPVEEFSPKMIVKELLNEEYIE